MADRRRAWIPAVRLALAVVMVGIDTAGAATDDRTAASTVGVALVRVPFPQDDGSLTPYTFELGYSLVSLVYDTLLLRDVDGVPRPWLARSVDTSSDGTTLTIRLEEGARWHDGAPVTSADVAFTFDYVRRRPHPRFTPQLRALREVATPDPATVVLTLRHPSAGFVDQPLADLPMLPAHLWEDLPPGSAAPSGLAMGSGPYRLVEHAAGKGYRFEADAAYFKGPPAVSTIDVGVITSVDEVVRSFEQRRVDVIPSGLPPEVAERLDGLGREVRRGTSYSGTVLLLNVRHPPFDRPDVRQAVASAVDLRRVVAGVGDGVPAERGYLHPASPWASPVDLHSFDLATARSRLQAGGLPPLEILVADNDPVRGEAGRQVASALERAGASASLRVVTSQELSRAVGEDGSTPSFQAAIWGAPPLASYDPDFLRRLFGSDPGDATLNYSGYASPTFDALAEDVATSPDAVARRTAVGEMLRVLSTDVPVVPLFFSAGAYAFRPAVYDGWVPVKGGGILDKRSFVRAVVPEAAPPDTPLQPSGDRGRSSPLGRIALVLLAAAAALASFGLVRRSR